MRHRLALVAQTLAAVHGVGPQVTHGCQALLSWALADRSRSDAALLPHQVVRHKRDGGDLSDERPPPVPADFATPFLFLTGLYCIPTRLRGNTSTGLA
jgi:hypothetical protein